jgi:predicted short-subunit dehydrogenase-like oxidoreductase (DUF2520 family)
LIKSVTIFGAGNVGTHLAGVLKPKVEINQIFSRNIEKARALSIEVGGEPETNLDNLNLNSDLYLLAVTDNQIEVLGNKLNRLLSGKIIAHTSGATPLIPGGKNNFEGVFYPLQTFSKAKSIDWLNTPILIEAENKKAEHRLISLANRISDKCKVITSEQRLSLHLAAVFACNFTNHLLNISNDILRSKNLEIELLYPLIKETIQKAEKMGPKLSQTGPAKRGDDETMEKHLVLLKESKTDQEIYKILSESIASRS